MIHHFFSVGYRNPGHWDISFKGERAFRVRGEPGSVVVLDERGDTGEPFPRESLDFPSVGSAMAWITDTIMGEIERQDAEFRASFSEAKEEEGR